MRQHYSGDDNAWARPSPEDQEHIDRVANYVANKGGDVAERLLLRLLRITKNYKRWGFLSPEHPYHPYYLRKKVSEQCRTRRPPAAS